MKMEKIQQPNTYPRITETIKERLREINERAQRIESFERDLERLLSKHGFSDILEYWRERADILGVSPRGGPHAPRFKHRRRTPEDDERILELTKEGRGSGEIAHRLGLSQSTVCNVRKMLRDQKRL